MDVGRHYQSNQRRLELVSEEEWVIALEKSRKHLKLRIKQKTLYGAHSEENLGDDPYDYYTSFAYEAILSGRWEWKSEFSLADQMIRIINSRISEEVEKVKREKSAVLEIEYVDIEDELYNVGVPAYDPSREEAEEWERQVRTIEDAIVGDDNLIFFWTCIKDGYKRVETADLMDLKPRQLDKVRERFVRTVRNHYSNITPAP